MFIEHLLSRPCTKLLNCLYHLIIRKIYFPSQMRNAGREKLSNLTKCTACKGSRAVDPDIPTSGLRLQHYPKAVYLMGLWPWVSASEKIRWSPVGCCGLEQGQACTGQSQSRDQKFRGSKKVELVWGKINIEPLYCRETPERLRSMLGLLSGVRWDVETILLHP